MLIKLLNITFGSHRIGYCRIRTLVNKFLRFKFIYKRTGIRNPTYGIVHAQISKIVTVSVQ